MSIVLAVASMERVVLKADGYKLAYGTGVLVEDFERVVQFNDNCIIGFTGFDEMAKMIIGEYIKMANQEGVDINSLVPTTIVYDLSEFAKSINKDKHELSMIVAGKQEDMIVLFGFSSTYDYEINNFSPEDPYNVKYITIGAKRELNPMDYSKFHRGGEPLESVMNNYIRYMSSIDDEVNDHIKTRKITL